jgi:hypothetical protein
MSAHRLRAAVCAAAVILAGLAGCGGRVATGAPPAADPTPATGGTPTTGAATSTGGPTTPTTANQASLAVYYLGVERVLRESDRTPIDRIKLYREFHRIAAGDGGARARTIAAVTEMLAPVSARDPDYRTGWPPGARVSDVRIGDGVVTVDIAGAARNNVGSEAAHQAVQQLVWTATAASGQSGVRLLVDGAPVDELWGHVAVGAIMRRAAQEDVQAHVWLIDPQHGARLGRTFTVHVTGYAYEATIHIEARQGDRIVHRTFVTVAGDGSFGEGRARLTLPPGRYTIEAYSDSGLADAGKPFLDDKVVTVG